MHIKYIFKVPNMQIERNRSKKQAQINFIFMAQETTIKNYLIHLLILYFDTFRMNFCLHLNEGKKVRY